MFSQKVDSRHYLGSTAFVLLFFLFICAFSENNDNSAGDIYRIRNAQELKLNAVAVTEVQQFAFLKSQLPVIDKLTTGQYNDSLQVIAGNYLFQQGMNRFQKTELLIIPTLLQRLFTYYHFIDTDDLPSLS
jgi:hypothetical protein